VRSARTHHLSGKYARVAHHQQAQRQSEILSGSNKGRFEASLERLLLLTREHDGPRSDALDKDEGVLDVSELDGLFTAVISGPNRRQ